MPPTENQVKLAISQVLSMPSAYNSPLSVLDFRINEKGIITGRFRDASRPRVFSFEIADDGITFSPFVPGRLDSLDIEEWEKFSEGYSFRLDAIRKNRTDKPKCKDGVSYPCGKSCISLKKQCKTNAKDPASVAKKENLKTVIRELVANDKNVVKGKTVAKVTDVKKTLKDPNSPIIENPTPMAREKLANSYTDNAVTVTPSFVDILSIKSDKKKTDFSSKQIEDLANSILECNGLLTPILVSRLGPDEYKVIKGDLEYHAAARALEKNDRRELINVIIADPSMQEKFINQAKLLGR